MTATATPATVARGMLGGVLRGKARLAPADSGRELFVPRGAGAQIGTDEDLTPTELVAIRNEKAAQALANTALVDLAITQAEVKEVRQLLLDMTVRHDALLAENEAARGVLEMAALVAHGHRGVEDMRAAWIQHADAGSAKAVTS